MSKIFIDLDGVLADCHMSALRHHGVDLQVYPAGMRVKDVLDTAGVETPDSYDEFWASFDEEFWATLPKLPDCDAILNAVKATFGSSNMFILSRPTSNPTSWSGKVRWVKNNLPKWIHNQIVLTEYKFLLANKESLLIDDSPTNCEVFKKYGGRFIFVRRPWNTRDTDVKEISQLLPTVGLGTFDTPKELPPVTSE